MIDLYRCLTPLTDAFWPPVCLCCQAPLAVAEALCFTCRRRLLERPGGRCPRCGLARPRQAIGKCLPCRRERGGYSLARYGAPYRSPFDRLVGEFKYGGQHCMLPLLERLLLRAFSQLPVAAGAVQAVCPVPMTLRASLRRAYNPAWLLADRLARRLGAPLAPRLLRARPGPRQAQLTRAERQANAQRRYVATGWRAPHTVLLVDDVFTTGATARSCAAALRQVGARRVLLVTAFRRL